MNLKTKTNKKNERKVFKKNFLWSFFSLPEKNVYLLRKNIAIKIKDVGCCC